jgi:hypothetical protein
MARERRRVRKPHEPDRRYGDRRLAAGFRTLVDGLVEKGEVEVVDSLWGREFVTKPPDEADPRDPGANPKPDPDLEPPAPA